MQFSTSRSRKAKAKSKYEAIKKNKDEAKKQREEEQYEQFKAEQNTREALLSEFRAANRLNQERSVEYKRAMQLQAIAQASMVCNETGDQENAKRMRKKLVALADQYDTDYPLIFTPGPSPLDYNLGSYGKSRLQAEAQFAVDTAAHNKKQKSGNNDGGLNL
jgi:hypothetical protein